MSVFTLLTLSVLFSLSLSQDPTAASASFSISVSPSVTPDADPAPSISLSIAPSPSLSPLPSIAAAVEQPPSLSPSPSSSQLPLDFMTAVADATIIPVPSVSMSSVPLAVSAPPSSSPASPPPSAGLPSPIRFTDETFRAGIRQLVTEQFGGPTIADLNNDGIYDLMLTNHNRSPMKIYFGNGDGTFRRANFTLKADIHGVSVAQRTARSSERIMALGVGGGRGTMLRVPRVFAVDEESQFKERSFASGDEKDIGHGVDGTMTRGRVVVFMDLKLRSRGASRANFGGPDALFINLLGNGMNLNHFAYENVKGKYELRDVPGFGKINEERALVTDIDNDLRMEVVHFSILRFFKVTAPFQLTDVTSSVMPPIRALRRSISSIVELDFDNDGRWDLYIARASSALVTPRGPPKVADIDDVLLRNVGGRYEDVSEGSGILKGVDSMGASAADFNNDGFIDIIVTTFDGADVIMLNDGGTGTFTQINPKTNKPSTRRGHNVQAVDYNGDGTVDYIAGQAFKKVFLGNYRLMKNQMGLVPGVNNYLHVRVGNEFTRACTGLNAVVRVLLRRGKKMVRRVGGSGAQAGGQSYYDTVHFGLGSLTKVRRVMVIWTVGSMRSVRGVAANQLIEIGLFF